jgi:hypothetical protein
VRRITKLFIIITVLIAAFLLYLTPIFIPQAKESELKTATVTLGTYRYEVVGFKPRRRGSSDIKAMIFQASDGQEYQVAMFYDDEAEALTGHTVTVRYVEDGGSYLGTHMIADMTEGEETHYTLAEWNQFQRRRMWLIPLMLWMPIMLTLVLVIEDLFSVSGRVKRYIRGTRKNNARAEQLDNLANRPHNFPGSVWKSTNGRLTLTVDEDGGITGVIGVLDKDGDVMSSVTVSFDDTAHTTIRIAPLEAGERVGRYIEIWEGDYDYPDRFTAKPLKTTYFKKGKTITVRRVNDDVS